jgi:FkbM family methyltransferase
MKIKIILFRMLRKFKLIEHLNINATMNSNNKKIKIPILGGVGFGNLYQSEPWMMNIIGKLKIKKNSIFIDVGVNIGQTLIKFKTMNIDADYLGFEPNPICISYLDSLIQANNWNNVKIIPVGIDQRPGVVFLNKYHNDKTDSSASIIENFRENVDPTHKSIVAVLGVENIVDSLLNKRVSIIKIDVEGAESRVIKSFFQIISEHRPYLLVEILPVYNNKNIERLQNQLDIELILKSLDYKIYRIQKNQNNNFHKLEEISSFGIHDRLDWCDYILAPEYIQQDF